MRRKVLFTAVLFVFCCSTLAAISVRETDIALSSAFDGTIAAVASVTSSPPLSLQGVSFEYTDSGLPWRIIFTRSDLSSYMEALSFNTDSRRRWYETLLDQGSSVISPFRERAISYLTSSSYEKGEIILDGTITLDTGEASNLDLLLSSPSWSGLVIPLDLSLMITSRETSSPLILEGDIEIIGGDDSKITVYSENLMINGEEICFSPFEISY